MTRPIKKTSSHFLYASYLFADREPTEIQTVLGSCVSVCLFDPVLLFGGINHYMMPIWKGEGLATPKFGNIAIEKLFEQMIALGADKKNLVAKVFGGAQQHSNSEIFSISQDNIAIAETMLGKLKIPISASNVGGKIGRKILFHSGTGLVYMKYVNQ